MLRRLMKRFRPNLGKDELHSEDETHTLPLNNLPVYTETAGEVTDFSSQYGSETSISYTACNLAGKTSIYPNYGDFTQACVFRIYGPWWDILPSSRAPFDRTPSTFYSQDYIELSFQTRLYPMKITVYETYNPGCVVRILACETTQDTDVDTGLKYTRWKTLWEGEPGDIPANKLEPRKFSPPLEPCPFPTNLIRLELCHRNAYYYTELDCVELTGTAGNPYDDEVTTSLGAISSDDGLPDSLVSDMGDLAINETNSREANHTRSGERTDPSGITIASKRVHTQSGEATHDSSSGTTTANTHTPQREITVDTPNYPGEEDVGYFEDQLEMENGYFDLLPEECIQLILSFLDVLSLCRVARTCRLFWKHSYDSLQYTELNLQPHWTQVNDVALDSLQTRSRFLQRLNLSWCHGNILSDHAFIRYLKTCGKDLKDLYLSSCNFLHTESVKEIVDNCPNLIELDIGSCQHINSEDLIHLTKLKHLQRLNLYRTMVNKHTITSIIRSCADLRHLNLGSCINIKSYDEVLIELSQHCPNLESLDLWRSHSVSHVGVNAIADGCPNLLELDIGWCNDVKSSTNCIVDLVKQCRKLKKLFLTANRTTCDRDLLAIAENSVDLEQLDILGTRQVSVEAAERVMQRCEKLCFFDVSFCSNIDQYTVDLWKVQFPHVAAKRSFQN